ncbi:hypothetical protein, partial [Nocardia sp. NPDC059154]|uniref:hypothetical protein n=1 Tax=Nocardia sp. NPDC059154 TaxID=3346744 RepID=UPI0036A8784B
GIRSRVGSCLDSDASGDHRCVSNLGSRDGWLVGATSRGRETGAGGDAQAQNAPGVRKRIPVRDQRGRRV